MEHYNTNKRLRKAVQELWEPLEEFKELSEAFGNTLHFTDIDCIDVIDDFGALLGKLSAAVAHIQSAAASRLDFTYRNRFREEGGDE